MAARNVGNNVASDVNSEIEIQNSESEASGVNVPKKVIKKIGKLVPEDKKTASGTKVQDSGERDALRKKEYNEASVNSEIINLINKIKSKDFKQNDKVILQKLSSDVANEIKK